MSTYPFRFVLLTALAFHAVACGAPVTRDDADAQPPIDVSPDHAGDGNAPDAVDADAGFPVDAAITDAVAAMPDACATFGFGQPLVVAVNSTGSWTAVGASLDEVLVYRSADRTLLHRLPTRWTPTALAFTYDDALLVVATTDGTVRLWDVAHETVVRTLVMGMGNTSGITAIAVTPTLLATTGIGGVDLWNVADGTWVRTLSPHVYSSSVAFSPDGTLVAAGDALYRVADGTTVFSLPIVQNVGVTFTPDGRGLVTVEAGDEFNDALSLWRVSDGTRIAQLQPASLGLLGGVAFRPDGRVLMVGSRTRGVVFIPVLTATGTWVATLTPEAEQPVGAVNALGLARNGSVLAALGEGVWLWDATSPTVEHDAAAALPEVAASNVVDTLLLSADATVLVMGTPPRSWDPTWHAVVRVADVPSHTVRYQLLDVEHEALTPNGSTVATTQGAVLTLRDARSGTALHTVTLPSPTAALAMSVDGSEVGAAGADGTIRRVRVSDATMLGTVPPPYDGVPAGGVASLAYAPDGRSFAVGFASRITVLGIDDTLRYAGGTSSLGGFSPNGLWLAQTSADYLHVDLVRVAGWRIEATLPAFHEFPYILGFDTLDGSVVVGGMNTQSDTAVVEHIASGTHAIEHFRRGGLVDAQATAVAFSGSGRQIALGWHDGVVQVHCR